MTAGADRVSVEFNFTGVGGSGVEVSDSNAETEPTGVVDETADANA